MTMDRRPVDAENPVAPTVRAAAVVFVATAVAFGVGTAVTLGYLDRNGELPMTPFGFRSLSGPFEALGMSRLTALGWLLVGVCAVEALAGLSLWRGERRGAIVGLATTPLAVGLGLGFALPFYLVSIPVRLGLLALGRRTLH
jgi:hypothetical protein